MEKFKKILKYVIYPASLIYTVLSAVFYIASRFLSTDEATVSYATLMLLLLLYAVVLALFTLVFTTKKSPIVKTVIHFCLTLGSLLFILFVLTNAFSTSSILIIIGVFTAVYLIVAVPTLIVIYKRKEKENESKEYKGMFTKKK